MRRRGRLGAALLAVTLALSALSCNGSNSNGNQSEGGQAGLPAPGRWVAQFRSPASAAYSGTNLAYFSYNALSVVNRNVVFVAGDMPHASIQGERSAVIVRTTDGGRTWTETIIEHPNMRITTLNDIHFLNERLGWAVGFDAGRTGVLLKTTDGGQTWTAAPVPFKQVPTSVFFVDENTGWMAGATPPVGEEEGEGGPSDLLFTSNGGVTWVPQRRVPTSLLDLFFLDAQTGWAVGHRASIYHTSDGGRIWNQQRSELEPGDAGIIPGSEAAKMFYVTGVQFVDRNNGWVSVAAEEEETGRALQSTNGGQVWTRRWIVMDAGVRGVHFISPTEGYAVVDNGPYAYRTTNGGRDWVAEPVVFEQQVPLYRVAAADADHVWAVGGGAIFFRQAQ